MNNRRVARVDKLSPLTAWERELGERRYRLRGSGTTAARVRGSAGSSRHWRRHQPRQGRGEKPINNSSRILYAHNKKVGEVLGLGLWSVPRLFSALRLTLYTFTHVSPPHFKNTRRAGGVGYSLCADLPTQRYSTSTRASRAAGCWDGYQRSPMNFPRRTPITAFSCCTRRSRGEAPCLTTGATPPCTRWAIISDSTTHSRGVATRCGTPPPATR